MNLRFRIVAITAGLLVAASGCASRAQVLSAREPGTEAGTTATTSPAMLNNDPNAAIALVLTTDGLAGVPVGSNVPRWVVPGAVAAPDGSAVFASESKKEGGLMGAETTRFWRIDPRTGAKTDVGKWVVPGGEPVQVFAVEPGGAQVALASFDGDRTQILPFDPATGGPNAKPMFDGHLEPEAFSIDRQRIFAARSFPDHYRITTLDIAKAEQYPTSNYDKTSPPEDMYGYVIQAVLTPDRTHLATLYRDPHATDHTAFVHLLDLEHGYTVCIDLPAPFGTGAPGYDAMRVNADGTLEIGHHEPGDSAGISASIDPNAILHSDPQRHYHAPSHASEAAPAVPSLVASTPGFKRFIAMAA